MRKNGSLAARLPFTGLLIFFFLSGLPACQLPVPQPLAQPSAVPGAPGIGDSYYPGLGNGGYDVQSYTITLDVDPLTNLVSGSTTISALAVERLSAFNLDFQGLSVDVITVNGKPAAFSQAGSELTITPSSLLDNQQIFNAVVVYHGSPAPVMSAAIPVLVGWAHSVSGAINVLSEPDGASTWFPNNDHPRDKAAYRFEITVPKPWVVAATGSLLQAKDLGEKTLYIWEMKKPMASYLAAIDIDRYDLATAPGPNGVTIRSYFPPGYPAADRQHFDALPAMLTYLETIYGSYPFPDYGVVIAAIDSPFCKGGGSADETQSLSIYCSAPAMSDERVIVHELAHQWFGDDVSLKNWQDVWLKEGMATYAEWLWLARGKDLSMLNKVVKAQTIGYYPSTLVGQPPSDELYRPEVYTGGGLVFHALRQKVGEEAFFKILRTYLSRFSSGTASNADFIALAEEISGQDLKSSFNDWLNTPEVPSLAP